MSFYQKLVKDKVNREKYEEQELLKKELIFKVNSLTSLHDGEFLTELDKFIVKFEKSKEK